MLTLLDVAQWHTQAEQTCSQITLLIIYFKKAIILLTTRLLLKHELVLTANNVDSMWIASVPTMHCYSTHQTRAQWNDPNNDSLTSLGATRRLVVCRRYCYCSQAAWACEPELRAKEDWGHRQISFLHICGSQICRGRSVAKFTCKNTANRELLPEL